MQFTIGQVAMKLGMSIHTLRYYEKEGLLPFVQRDEGGNRMYTADDVDWLFMVRCLRDTEMPIRDIKQYIAVFMQGTETISKRREIVLAHRERIEEKMRAQKRALALLDKKMQYFDKAENAPEMPLCSDFETEWAAFKGMLEGMVF